MIWLSLRPWRDRKTQPPARAHQRSRRVRIEVELLESRLAPATLVNPQTVTYQDAGGSGGTGQVALFRRTHFGPGRGCPGHIISNGRARLDVCPRVPSRRVEKRPGLRNALKQPFLLT